MKIVLSILLVVITSGCAHKMTYTNFKTGEVLQGEYLNINRSISVTMSDGELLKGNYSKLTGGSYNVANATATSGFYSASVQSSGMNIGGIGTAYGILISDTSPLMMELTVSFNVLGGSGYGEAKTNDGRTYKVMF